MKNNTDWRLKFPEEVYTKVSSECLSLIVGMLKEDFKRRITVD